MAISDGDTFTLLTGNQKQVKIRLAQIDAPESGQPWGAKSKLALSNLLRGKKVSVGISGADRYGRSIGEVYAGPIYVNADMVKSGNAWAFLQYLTDKRFIAFERAARTARYGLWSMPPAQTIAPWDWRANRRANSGLTSASTAEVLSKNSDRSPSRGDCAAKRYCKQMTSCIEARLYLRQCHTLSLDGDGDGIPCEKLCRGG